MTRNLRSQNFKQEGRQDASQVTETEFEALVACFFFDSQGRVLRVNQRGALLLGLDSKRLLDTPFTRLLDPTQQALFNDFLVRVFSTAEPQCCDLDMAIPGREQGLTLCLEALACDDQQECRVVAADISRLKQSESKFRELQESLEQRVLERTESHRLAEASAREASLAKSSFLANMSHEIRTPMNGVIGMADMLSQTVLESDQREMVEMIRESAGALLGIINGVLDFSEVEAGKVEVNLAPMQITPLVEHVCRLLEIALQKDAVELTVFIDPLVPATVLCDSLRLRQVLLNLVGNAIKFSAREDGLGRVQLRVYFYPQGNASGMLEITVIDNGIGMDAQTQLTMLTTPYAQADATTKRRYGGTGLGLPISSALVALMGGELTVESSPGKGSTFTVRMTVDEVPGDAVSAEHLPDVTGLNCLVAGGGQADDFARYLRHAGASVEQVPDLAGTASWMSHTTPGVWVWLVDTEKATPSREELAMLVEGARNAGFQMSIALILHGKRRTPRELMPGVVTLDCNVLMPQGLLATVALAAGRGVESLGVAQKSPVHSDSPVPLTRDEALAQGRLCLVAEDDRLSQKVIQHQLGLLGLVVDIACDGREALALWRSTAYAALLTDLQMPDMDGFQLAATIRREEQEGQHIPIIALSASTSPDDAQRAQRAGIDGYVSKPARPDELRAVLEKWLPPL
jgi:signal transduction histidine kinase